MGCEPASAVTLAGLKKLVKQGFVKPNESVVLILTGHVLKDPEFTLKFHRGDLFTGTPDEKDAAMLVPSSAPRLCSTLPWTPFQECSISSTERSPASDHRYATRRDGRGYDIRRRDQCISSTRLQLEDNDPLNDETKEIRKASVFRLSLPATSANLGPAFDAAALAFDLHLKFEARLAPDYSIRATGRDSDICGNLENHLILNTYREVLRAEGQRPSPLALEIRQRDSHRQRLRIIGRGASCRHRAR